MKWRCKKNGVVIELKETETKQMLEHPGYEKVADDPPRDNKPSPKKAARKRSNRSK